MESTSRRGEKAQKYKKMVTSKHNLSRESFLPKGSYKKLHSYTHLLNGFAVDAEYEKDDNVAAAIRRRQRSVSQGAVLCRVPRERSGAGRQGCVGAADWHVPR